MTGFISWAKRAVPSLGHMQGPKIKKALVEEWGCKADSSNGKRILEFPPLAELRKMFEQRIGHRVKWDNPEMTDWERPEARGPGWKSLQ